MSYTPAYRYLLCDLLTDQVLAEVPLTGVSFDRRISRVGSLSGTLSAPDAGLVEVGKLVHRYAGRSALWVYRDGQLWWGGIPWTVVPSQAARGPVQVSVTAATFDSYAHRRLLRTDVTYTGVDQGVIIPDLWRILQSDPRGDIGMVATDRTTGITRDRTYLAAEQNYVGPLIEALGDVIDGPEHTIDVYVDGAGNRVKTLRVANRLGLAQPRHLFQRGGITDRITEWEHAADTVDAGTTFQTRGDAVAGVPLLSDVVESALLDEGWPLLDVAEDRSGVTDPDTLDDYAAALAAGREGQVIVNSYTVEVGADGWSPNRIGDAVRIKMSDTWHGDSDVTVRPVGVQVTAPDKGQAETVKLLLGDED